MKLLHTLFSFFLFFAFVNAQASFIRLPRNNTVERRGRNFIVQIVRPNSIQGSIEVGIVIGLFSCPNLRTACPPPIEVGTILFKGNFNPQLHEIPGQPYQNFTVTVPRTFTRGRAQLTVNRFHLIGAGPAAVLESNGVILRIV